MICRLTRQNGSGEDALTLRRLTRAKNTGYSFALSLTV